MKILLTIFLSLFCINVAVAHVHVFFDKNSKEVIFLTETDNVFIDPSETNIEEAIIPQNIEFYGLTEPWEDYKFQNNKFVLNTQKISDKQDVKDQRDADKVKKDSDFDSAKTKLMSATWVPLTSDEVDSLLK